MPETPLCRACSRPLPEEMVLDTTTGLFPGIRSSVIVVDWLRNKLTGEVIEVHAWCSTSLDTWEPYDAFAHRIFETYGDAPEGRNVWEWVDEIGRRELERRGEGDQPS